MSSVLTLGQTPEKSFLDPDVIKAAAESPLGIFALMILLLGALAFVFFRKASERVRFVIFTMLFVGVVGFGVALFRADAVVAQVGHKTLKLEQSRASIVTALREIETNGGEGAVLIRAKPFYVQCAKTEHGFHVEAVSNRFLSSEYQISLEKEQMLLELGFERPDSVPNFNKAYRITDKESIELLADEFIRILRDVYGQTSDSEVVIETR